MAKNNPDKDRPLAERENEVLSRALGRNIGDCNSCSKKSASVDPNDRRRRNVATYVMVLIGVVVGSLAYVTLDPNHFFYKEKISRITESQSYYYNLHLRQADVSNSSNVFDIRVTFLSESFSAQVKISVTSASVQQLQGSPVHSLTMIFPRANDDDQKTPSVFDATNGVPLLFEDYGKDGLRVMHTEPGPNLRYDIQGCYNIVVISNTTRIDERQLYQYDCSVLNVAPLDVTKNIQFAKENLDIENSIIEQNNITIKVALYGFFISVAGIILTIIMSFYFSRTSSLPV